MATCPSSDEVGYSLRVKRQTCLDCDSPLVQKPGRGRGLLRCPTCIASDKVLDRRARRDSVDLVRTCVKCLTNPAMRGRSHCTKCTKKPPRDLTCACRRCGTEFVTRHPLTVFCSATCRKSDHDARPKLATTTERGYGRDHQNRRQALLDEGPYWKPCPLCGADLLPSQPVDLDHSVPLSTDRTSVGDRIVHRSCNRRQGQSIQLELRRARVRALAESA